MPHTTGRKSHPQIRNEQKVEFSLPDWRCLSSHVPRRIRHLSIMKLLRCLLSWTRWRKSIQNQMSVAMPIMMHLHNLMALMVTSCSNSRNRCSPNRIFSPTFKRSEADQREFDACVQEEVDKFKSSMQDEI